MVGLSVGLVGCSKEDITKAIEDAKAKTQSIAETAVTAAEEQLPETGSVRLEMNPPLQIDQAEIEVISIGDGRPNVVQISTYDTARKKTFPALLLHGTTSATNASALARSSIDCDMYVQAASRDPIAMTKPGGSVKLTFESLNVKDNAIPATLAMAELIDSDGNPVLVQGGALLMVVRGEGNAGQ